MDETNLDQLTADCTSVRGKWMVSWTGEGNWKGRYKSYLSDRGKDKTLLKVGGGNGGFLYRFSNLAIWGCVLFVSNC